MRLYVTTSIESMGWPSQGVQYMVYIRRIRSNCMDRWTNIRFPSQANGHDGHEQRKRISCAKANSIRIRACTKLQNRIIYMYVLTCTNVLELASNTHTLDDVISRVGLTQQPASHLKASGRFCRLRGPRAHAVRRGTQKINHLRSPVWINTNQLNHQAKLAAAEYLGN
jgi:hypothetical protein